MLCWRIVLLRLSASPGIRIIPRQGLAGSLFSRSVSIVARAR